MTSSEHKQQVQQYIDQIEKEFSITIRPDVKWIWLNHNKSNPETRIQVDITGKEPPPWRKPGYTGKLKSTIRLPCQPGYEPPDVPQSKMIEAMYESFALGEIDNDILNRSISRIYVEYPSA